MDFVCEGRAFLVSGFPFSPAPHLWFILCHPSPTTGKIVAVMVVTERPHTDKTVTLAAGDHPFIKHRSNVDFGGALLVDVRRLHDAIRDRRCTLQPDMSPELLVKVREGLIQSSRTVDYIREYCSTEF